MDRTEDYPGEGVIKHSPKGSARWSRGHRAPSHRDLNSQGLTLLTQTVPPSLAFHLCSLVRYVKGCLLKKIFDNH